MKKGGCDQCCSQCWWVRCCCAPDAANRGDIYTAGVYTASAEGYSGPVTVEVEFDGSSILSVHVLSHSETVNISDRAINELPFPDRGGADLGCGCRFICNIYQAMPFVKRSEIASRRRHSDEPFALKRVFLR